MEACAHPGFEKHRDLHRELIVEVNSYARKWRNEQNQENLGQFRKFLKDWLFDHILNEDVKIASSARGRGQDIRMVLETLE